MLTHRLLRIFETLGLFLASTLDVAASPSGLRSPHAHAIACPSYKLHGPVVRSARKRAQHRATPYQGAVSASNDDCLNIPLTDDVVPSPLVSIKKCLVFDDTDCYEQNKDILLNSQQRIYEKLLPTLVAHFGAPHTWNAISLDPNDRRYRFCVKRFKSIHGKVIEEPGLISRGEPKNYDYDSNWIFVLRSEENVSSILHEFKVHAKEWDTIHMPQGIEKKFRQFFSVITGQRSDYNLTMPPTVVDIVKVLETQDTNMRRKGLFQLQKRIDQVLSESIFSLDDIIGTANIMFLLVWRFANDEDKHTQNFIRDLLNKGAPISERNIFRNYYDLLTCDDYENRSSDLEKYEKLAKMVVDYSSASPLESLVYVLRTYPWSTESSSTAKIPGILTAYREIYPNLDMLSPSAIKALAHCVSFLDDSEHVPQLSAILSLFIKFGLTKVRVNEIIEDQGGENSSKSKEMTAIMNGLSTISNALDILEQYAYS